MQKTASNADKTATSDARTIEQDALVNHESSGSKVAQEPHYIYVVSDPVNPGYWDDPTHWMPLPPPPVGTTAEAETQKGKC